MAADPLNFFGLPGMHSSNLGATGNPLAASLEMMQSAMSSFGQSASLASGSMAQSLNPDDLEKRIAELRAVESWLKLNLSMLGGSIQGMEVQLATIKTLRAFVEMGAQAKDSDSQQASPLEVVLGLKKPVAAASVEADPLPETMATPSPAGTETAAASPAAQAWWNMLQNQFSHLAQATAQAAQYTQEVNTKSAAAEVTQKRTRKVASRKVAKSPAKKTSISKNPKPPCV